MSLVLHPQNSFTVVRQIANHTDNATYYVRAVIRNAYTDNIIETLNLTDRGGQRFSKNWQVPADVSGQGFYISIVTSVYTDSGYTTKSENYGDEETTYLVQDRLLGTMRGGSGIDAYTVRRIVREELDKQQKPEPFDYDRLPRPTEFKDRTEEILQAVRSLDKEPEKLDLSPAFAEVKKAIADKEVTPPPDLYPLESGIQALKAAIGEAANKIITVVTGIEDTVAEKAATAVKEEMENVEWETSYTTKGKKEQVPKAEEPVPFDISQLNL